MRLNLSSNVYQDPGEFISIAFVVKGYETFDEPTEVTNLFRPIASDITFYGHCFYLDITQAVEVTIIHYT